MTDIFISYASEDRSRAETLAKTLEALGWSVWWDRTIPPGKAFDQVIQEAIESARCVVVLWSNRSIRSDWVKEEANIGKERKILVPAKIDPVDLPLGFGRIQAADLINWQAEKGHPGFLSLQNAISELAGPPSESETPQAENTHFKAGELASPGTDPKAPRKKRLVYGTGAAALIFLLCAIGWFLFSKHTITVQYDAKKGSISADNVGIPPSGEVEVTDGNSLGLTITPEPDYYIVDLVVDGKSVGANSSYTMEDVKDDHTLSARFMKNLSLEDGAKAEQSGDYGKNPFFGAGKAIDGDTKSFTQTEDIPGSFWRVKLPKPANIEKIVIWNRSDCCGNRLSNFKVSVLDDSKAPVWYKDREEAVKQGGSEEFKPAPPAKGQYVEVKFHKGVNFDNNGYLSLAEVQVFGEFTE